MSSRAQASNNPGRVELPYRWNGCIVAMAASTGGIEAITRVLEDFPCDGPPVLVVQHMPGGGITGLFAHRIDRKLRPHVVEAENGMPIEPGMVYIAPGGANHLVAAPGNPPSCRLIAGPPVNGHRPCADILFRSLESWAPGKVVAVILTGMGDDGAESLLQLRCKGMRTIGQDAGTALVYGMPRAAAERGAVEDVLPLAQIGPRILELCRC